MNKNKFIHLYSSNTPYGIICRELGMTSSMVTYYANKYKLRKRGSGRNNSYKNPFTPLTADSYYWLGYILADGNLESKIYKISLFSNDEDILKDFLAYCRFGSFYKRNSIGNAKPIIEARIISKEITNWVSNFLGIDGKKALIINPPIRINWPFLHGYFDGDGCIRLKGCHNEAKFTTGSLKWAYRIKEFIFRYGIISSIKKKGNAYDVNIYKKASVKLLYYYLYKEGNYKLNYKYNRFVALFGDRQMIMG
jgi:intein/homing endonuclease